MTTTTTLKAPGRGRRRLPAQARAAVEFLTRQVVFASLALITAWGAYKVWVEYPATMDALGCYGFHPGRALL